MNWRAEVHASPAQVTPTQGPSKGFGLSHLNPRTARRLHGSQLTTHRDGEKPARAPRDEGR